VKYIIIILKMLAQKNITFRRIVRRLIYIIKSAYYLFFYYLNKTQPNLVLFEAYMGRSYACSPKALYEAMQRDKSYQSFHFVWAFFDCDKYEFLKENKNTSLVKYGSKEYYITYSQAKYWISNSRIPEQIRRRRDQIYIQTWHGTPLKRLGFDVEVEGGNAMNTLKELQNKYTADARRYSYMLSPSAFCTQRFISAFNLDELHQENIILEKGYPRNDALFRYTEQDCRRIKATLGLSDDKKIILYAPTWRDNQHEAGLGYTYSVGVDFDFLRRELGKDYVILFRSHYFIANNFNFGEYQDFIVDVSNYDDINDLYVISDMLITDYSSVFFDYANLKKPILFYMYDLEFYKNKLRDFYIELENLPGNVVQTEQELVRKIHRVSKHFFIDERYTAFNRRFNYLDGPNTSEKVLSVIINGGDLADRCSGNSSITDVITSK